jgi:anti-anti-sigma regulatory factor
MGTAPEAEGHGLGRVLLHRCLADLYAAGHGKAVIPWVGPISFYARHCGARVDRVFWRFRRAAGVRLEGDRLLQDGETAVLTVAGRWSGASPCPVDRAIQRHFARGVHRVVIDGARLEAISDAAPGQATAWGGKLRAAGGLLCFVRIPPPVHTAMELAGVLTTAVIRETLAEAQQL